MKTSSRLLTLFALLLLPLYGNATHMMGADISYKWLGNKKYEITARVYRDCRGIPFNSPDMAVRADNLGSMPLSYTRTSIQDITIRCKDSSNGPCSPQNTTISREGIELHTFVAIVDFSTSPYDFFPGNSACKIYFSISQCCRNSALTTLSQGTFYVEAMLDICNSNYQNNSPQFKTRNVQTAVCNQPFRQNFGSRDFIDFDSLGYELVTPLNAANSNETYSSGFTNQIPMTPYCKSSGNTCAPTPTTNPPQGFYLDRLTGDIVFTPTKCTEVGEISMKVSEYRKDPTTLKWLLIGHVIRDIQIIVINGSSYNTEPSVSLANIYTFKTNVKQCFDFATKDTAVSGAPSNNQGDKTFINIAELPPGATLKYVNAGADNKTGRFCWQIPDSVYLKYKNKDKLLPIMVEVTDNFCYLPSIIQKSFYIKMLAPNNSGLLNINTFEDHNKNNLKDTIDKGVSALLKFKDNNGSFYVDTDEKGVLEDSIGSHVYTIGVANHPYFSSVKKDTTLNIIRDSVHKVNFGIMQSNGVYGRIYEDANGNCRYDKNELVYSGYKVYSDSNKYTGISDRNGIYYLKLPKGNYKLHCELNSARFKINCPSSNSISVSVTGDSVYLNNDFGISLNMQYMDIKTGISLSRSRKDAYNPAVFYCVNDGPKTAKNITLLIPVSKGFDLVYKNNIYANAGTTASVKIDSIPSGQRFSIKFDYFISASIFNTGDRICFTVTTDSLTTVKDSVRSNNYSMECRQVTAGFDPNEKIVSIDSAKTTLDKTISYTVHFQNSGTDTATRIVVTDTVDTKFLDPARFELNWSDFSCETIISGNILYFIFNNINLPYFSKSGDKSQAGFSFTIGLRSDVPEETSFANRASIYFDSEKPVITKKAIATINSPVALYKIAKTSICKNEGNRIYYKSKIKLEQGNTLFLEVSDNTGSFANPTIIKSVKTVSLNDSIDFNLPANFNAAAYTIRIRSTQPASVSIPITGYMNYNAVATPGYFINTTTLKKDYCEKDTLQFNFINATYLYKILKNKLALNSFSNISSFKSMLELSDSFNIIAQDPNTGCKDTFHIFPLIHPEPTIPIIVSGKKSEYCSNTLTNINTGGAYWYQCLKNGALSGGKKTQSTFQVLNDQSAYYQISGTDTFGCTNISDTVYLNVIPSPSASLSYVPDPVCQGDSVTLVFGTAPRYDLLVNSNRLLSQTMVNQYRINNPVSGDNYQSVSYGINGCVSRSNIVTLNIHPVPASPFISNIGNDLSVNYSGRKKWFRNGLPLTDTSAQIKNASGGIYTVVVTNAEGCSSTSNTFVHRNSGLTGVSTGSLSVYPNPAQETLNIEWLGPEQELTLCLMDMNGRVIYEARTDNRSEIIHLTGFPSGLYTLRVTSNDGSVASQLISIQH